MGFKGKHSKVVKIKAIFDEIHSGSKRKKSTANKVNMEIRGIPTPIVEKAGIELVLCSDDGTGENYMYYEDLIKLKITK